MRASLLIACLICLIALVACTREFGLTLIASDGTTGTGRASERGDSETLEIALRGKTYLGQANPATGRALMRAQDGSALRCLLPFSGRLLTGPGSCVDETGKIYASQVWR